MKKLQQEQVSPSSKPKEFYNQLLYLEEQFFSRTYDNNIVSELIRCYGILVEYYDSKRDPIKNYFLEKIQFAVSRPETLKLIIPQAKIPQTQRKQVNFSVAEQQPTVEEIDHEIATRTYSSDRVYLGRYSISRKKQERAANFKIFMEVDQQQPEQQNDMDQLLKEYEEVSAEYNKMVELQLQQQEETLKRKLMQRGKGKRRANSSERNQQKVEEAKPEPITIEPTTTNTRLSFVPRKSIVEEIKESTKFMRQSISRLSMSQSLVSSSPINRGPSEILQRAVKSFITGVIKQEKSDDEDELLEDNKIN